MPSGLIQAPAGNLSPDKPHSLERTAHLLWRILIGVIIARGLIWPHRNNCFLEHYRPAGLNWLWSRDLYEATADTCRYSPLIHALLVPFSALPERIGSTLWRLAECFSVYWALLWWLRTLCPPFSSARTRGLILLAALPIAIGSLNNGQSNGFMIAGMLWGVAAASEERWLLAAFSVAFATSFKIYPVALALLLMLHAPRAFTPRFLLAIVVCAVLPFFFQSPSYVTHQYARWFQNLNVDDRSAWPLSESYRDAWLLTRRYGPAMSHLAYQWLQLAAALVIAIACFAIRANRRENSLNITLGLAVCWMTAFGPATESPTYILLAPTLGWLLASAWAGPLPRWTRVPATLSALLFYTTAIATATPAGRTVLMLGTQPVGALLILGTLLILSRRDSRGDSTCNAQNPIA